MFNISIILLALLKPCLQFNNNELSDIGFSLQTQTKN